MFRRTYTWTATIGLGLGIGLAIAIHTFPTMVNAEPPAAPVNQIQLEIEQIKSTELGLNVKVKPGNIELLPLVKLEAPAVHLRSSAGIGQGKAIVIQGTSADYSFYKLDQAKLGKEMMILGSNGGWYRYRIVETKLVDYDQLGEVFTQERETLVLFTTQPLQQTATVVLARPLQ